MPATYVTEAELRSALGIGALYSSAVVEECCQAAEDIVKSNGCGLTPNPFTHWKQQTQQGAFIFMITLTNF